MIASIVQLLGTLLILISPYGNVIKTISLLLFWFITFWPIPQLFLLIFFIISIFFSLMDIHSVQIGYAHFHYPDAWGLPYYEFFMWGFFLLHAFRTLGLTPSTSTYPGAIVAFAFLFALPFNLPFLAEHLLSSLTTIIVISLCFFHEKSDFLYIGYFIFMGLIVEYLGVKFGQWNYPGLSQGQVALWVIPMWAGIGYYAHRCFALLPAKIRNSIGRK